VGVVDVLEHLYADICNKRWIDDIDTTTEDIEIVGCKNMLRAFKLTHPVPAGFKCSASLTECVKQIREKKDYFRLLEFFMLRNPVLRDCILGIIPELGGASNV